MHLRISTITTINWRISTQWRGLSIHAKNIDFWCFFIWLLFGYNTSWEMTKTSVWLKKNRAHSLRRDLLELVFPLRKTAIFWAPVFYYLFIDIYFYDYSFLISNLHYLVKRTKKKTTEGTKTSSQLYLN